MRRLTAAAGALVLAGCSMSLGTVGVVAPEASSVGLKMLRPAVRGRSCRRSIAGLPLDAGEPELREAMAQILALDPEGNALSNAEVRSQRLVTGLYNRRCVEVRGDLVRIVPTVTLPMPAHH